MVVVSKVQGIEGGVLFKSLREVLRNSESDGKIHDFVGGEKYCIEDYAVTKYFNNELTPYIFEEVTERYIICVTNSDMKRKYAVYSNDSEQSGLESHQSAMMVATEGDIINFIDFKDINDDGSFNIYNFRYIGVEGKPTEPSDNITIEVECIGICTTIAYPEWCGELVTYLDNTISRLGIPVQLIDKFSYNNSRCIGFGMFHRDDRGDLVMHRLGKTYKINRKSNLHGKEDGGLIRFYYSKKFRSADEIFVDGVYIPEECIQYDINEFINSKNFVENISDDVVVINTKNGKFYGYIQNNGRIKLIIKLGKSFKFIHLSDDEASNVVKEINGI